ncbi:PREDICTED: deleted in malignant brain tumors 1 protein-like isoform X2 [Calidris pugnax]|uniref:deleted in malignant brain tumors 1 protein-like isoform X2 n=1 Tax=Calidris pugnax TaxID=198806 RepID=UPI00071DB92F|nr:PREDICTED: deleted in malignant brain tumors 1 protein-like isoform X2 [Calidris pugnax]
MAATMILSWMVMLSLQIQVDAGTPATLTRTATDAYNTITTTSPVRGSRSCGGFLEGWSGSFQSPGYPNSYPNNARCIWNIQLPQWDLRVELQFVDVELEGNSCTYDAIKVYDGGYTGAPLLGTVCRNDHRVFRSSGYQMTILFRSDGSVTQRGFQAYYSSFHTSSNTTVPDSSTLTPPVSSTTGTETYSTIPTTSPVTGPGSCGGFLLGWSGSFQSPGYPYSYPNNTRCIWNIRLPERDLRVELQFVDVELEGNSCTYDAIEVYDGGYTGAPLLGTVCRNDHRVFRSSGYQMTILFHSDSSITERGFRAYYSSFHAPSTTTAPGNSTSTPPVSSTTGPGFCGGFLLGWSGSFQSPGYPYSYPNNAHCIWKIQLPERDLRVELQFVDVELEGVNCTYDAIEVYDGGYTGAPLLGTVCRNDHRVFRSSGYQMTILFHSDISFSGRGFQAYYSSFHAPSTTTAPGNSTSTPPVSSTTGSCGGFLEGWSGSFQSPGYPYSYPNNAYCIWNIQLPQWDLRVELQFVDVELEGNSCTYDAIEVYDGGYTGAPLLGTVCRNDHRVFRSSGYQMTILFRSDGSVTRRGFQAYYSSFHASSTTTEPDTSSSMPTMSTTPEDYSCGGLLFSPSGTLQSPFYPRNYPNNADCVWEIEVQNNFRVILTFRDVQMEGGRCLSDYVEVYDGPLYTSPLLGKFCSGSYRTYESSSNLLTVRFHSNSRYTYRGFQADYYSTPADQNTKLLCLPDYMRAVVSRYFLQSQGYSPWRLSLNDPSCKPNITSDSVIFDIPYTGCGTEREGNNNTITYSNLIRGSSSGTVITRTRNLHLHIHCKMLQDTWAQIMYVAEDNFEVNETQYSRYDVNLTFYHSSSFSWPVYESPYYVNINQNLFLEAYLHSSDPNLVLFLDTCVASPTPHNFTTATYDIIRNGCVRDSTYYSYSSPYRNRVRFGFNAFQFIHYNPSVYLQCELVVCRAYDYSSRCYRGCITRSKREASSGQERVTVVVGPVELREDGVEKQNAHDVE